MFAVQPRISRVSMVVATALSFEMLPASAQAYSQEEQAACTNDAFRVCGSEIPDVDRVTACMVRNRALLSPGCKVYFRETEAAPLPPPERAANLRVRAKSSASKSAGAKSSAAKKQKAKEPD